MTFSNSIIDNTSEHYRQRVAKATQDQQRVDELKSLSTALLNASTGHHLADPARYHRKHGADDMLGAEKMGSYGHWARHYLDAFHEPSYYHFQHALEKLADQSADQDGQHTPQNAATFTVAATQILATAVQHMQTVPEDNDGLVDLTLGLIRSAAHGVYPTHELEILTGTAFCHAVHELIKLHENTPKHQAFTRIVYDDLGRTQYHTSIVRAFMRANRLEETIKARYRFSPDDPDLQALSEIADTNLRQWTEQSFRICAFDAISESHVHNMAAPLNFSAADVGQIAKTAQDIIAKHPNTNLPKAEWLVPFTANLRPAALDTVEQADLCGRIDGLIREYNDWFDRTINFDDYSSPKDDNFAKLETLNAEQSVLQTSIIVAAARITDPEHATRRDAIMTAAAGTINWQCRQEFDSYVKHAGPAAHHRNAVLERLNTANAIVRAMPAQVIPEEQKQAILQHDDERRQEIDENVG
jgi:hypothetical protein